MKFEELHIGQEYRMLRKFSKEDVAQFASVSTDFNPIHVDTDYAEKSMFKRNIVHGFLTGSLFSAIIGTKMPGEGSIYLKQDMKFLKPIYVDEEVAAIVSIKDIKTEKRIITLKTVLENHTGELAIDGEAVIKFIG